MRGSGIKPSGMLLGVDRGKEGLSDSLDIDLFNIVQPNEFTCRIPFRSCNQYLIIRIQESKPRVCIAKIEGIN